MNDLLECPCCKTKKELIVFDENYLEDPPQRVICTHCHGVGYVAPDNRSMNQYE